MHSGTTSDPDGGWSWLVLISAMVNMMMVSGMVSAYGLLLVRIQEEFGSSSLMTAAILGTLLLARGVGGAVVLYLLSYRLRLYTLIMAGGVIHSVGLFASNFAPGVTSILVSGGLVSGIGIALCYGTSIIALGHYFDRQHLLTAYSATMMGANIGRVVFPFAYLMLLKSYGIYGTYLILSAVVLHSVACGAILRLIPTNDNGTRDQTTIIHSVADVVKTTRQAIGYVLIFMKKALLERRKENVEQAKMLISPNIKFSLYSASRDDATPTSHGNVNKCIADQRETTSDGRTRSLTAIPPRRYPKYDLFLPNKRRDASVVKYVTNTIPESANCMKDQGDWYHLADQDSGYCWPGRDGGYRLADQDGGYRLVNQEAGYSLVDQNGGYRLTDQEIGCRLADQEIGCRLADQEIRCRLMDQDNGYRLADQDGGYSLANQENEHHLTDQDIGHRRTHEDGGYRLADQENEHHLTDQDSGHRRAHQDGGYRLADQDSGCRLTDQENEHHLTDQDSGHRRSHQDGGYRLVNQDGGYRLADQDIGCRLTDQEGGYHLLLLLETDDDDDTCVDWNLVTKLKTNTEKPTTNIPGTFKYQLSGGDVIRCNDINAQIHNEPDRENDDTKNKFIKTNKLVLMSILIKSLNSAGTTSQFAFFPLRVNELGISLERAAILIATTALCQMASKPLFSMVAATGVLKKQYMVVFSSTVVAILTICVPMYTSFAMLLIFASTIGIFGGTFSSSAAVLLAEHVGPERLPQALAIDVFWRDVILASAQTFLGWLGDVTGGFTACYLVMGGMEMLAVLLMIILTVFRKFNDLVETNTTDK